MCRIVLSRIDDGSGEKRRLLSRECGSGLSEVNARSGLAAEDAVAPLDDVEVDLQNPALGERGLEPPGNHQLLELPHRVPGRRQVQVLGKLLRDRAGAARELSFLPIRLERCANLLKVDPFVVEKRRVLRNEHRTPQRVRDARVRHPLLADLKLPPLLLRFAFAQLHERAGFRIDRGQRPNVRQCQINVGKIRKRKDRGEGSRTQNASHVLG